MSLHQIAELLESSISTLAYNQSMCYLHVSQAKKSKEMYMNTEFKSVALQCKKSTQKIKYLHDF